MAVDKLGGVTPKSKLGGLSGVVANSPSGLLAAKKSTTTGPDLIDRMGMGTVPTPVRPAASTPAPAPAGGGGGGTGGVTAEKRRAASNLTDIAGANAQAVVKQWENAVDYYNLADRQNRQSAQVQEQQASRTSADDRFAQARRLQAAVAAILNGSGNAMEGSQAYRLSDMLRSRDDLDTAETLGTLTTNWNAIRNALNEALNANVLGRNEAANTAENSLRAIETDTAAQLNNIDPSLYSAPGSGGAFYGANGWAAARQSPANLAALAGYILPAPQAKTNPATGMGGGSYFDTLMSGYRGRQ